MADALPLLQKASHVALVEIADERYLDDVRTRLADVAAWLARHGIVADRFVLPSAGDDAARLTMLPDD